MIAPDAALPLFIVIGCAIGAAAIAAGAALMAFRLPCAQRREAVAACFGAMLASGFCLWVAQHPAFWVALP